MFKTLVSAVTCLFISSCLFGFNIDPLDVNLKLKKGEKSEVLFRIKNTSPSAVNVEVSAKDAPWIAMKPPKFKMEKDGYTYCKAKFNIPKDAEKTLTGGISFKITGSAKKGPKVDELKVIPVTVEIYADKADKGNKQKK